MKSVKRPHVVLIELETPRSLKANQISLQDWSRIFTFNFRFSQLNTFQTDCYRNINDSGCLSCQFVTQVLK